MYCNELTDSFGYVHSIDMIYVEYFSLLSCDKILDIVRDIHTKYTGLKYNEYLDNGCSNKWCYYKDFIVIGGVTVYVGKYHNYDKLTKTHDIFPMFQLRFNPNKYFQEDWFQMLFNELMRFASGGIFRKFDYAIDIKKDMQYVQIFNTRKEKGLYRGTRYYGQSGRHGYLKIYDKAKELKDENINTLTRVEHTLFYGKSYSLEDIYIYCDDVKPLNDLKDTDFAIVDMFLQLKALGVDYDLHLGRGKMLKLSEYLTGSYKKIEYGDYLDRLLDKWKKILCINEVYEDENGFLMCEDLNLPFD